MLNISFSNQEAQALIQLIDIAVKAGGLQVAPAAVVLHQKIMSVITTPVPELVVDNGPVEEAS